MEELNKELSQPASPPRSRVKGRFFVVAVTMPLICTGGCRENGLGPQDRAGFNTGTIVHEVPEFAVGSSPSWVIPDSVLAFRSSDRSGIKLLDVASGSTQLLDGPTNVFGLTIAPTRELVSRHDGSTVFYVHNDPDISTDVLRAASLLDGGVTTLEVGGPFSLALRPDDGALAYQRGALVELVLLDLSSMQKKVVAGGGLPLSFSPDGSELLVVDDHGGLSRVDLTTGFTEQVWSTSSNLLAARWDTAGIRLLLKRGSDVEVLSPGTGRIVPIAMVQMGETAFPRGAWSIEGDRIAFWTDRCLGSGPFGGCGDSRLTVYVGNAQTGGATPLAVEDGHGSSALLFSSDGRRLYYSVSGKLYVADVP